MSVAPVGRKDPRAGPPLPMYAHVFYGGGPYGSNLSTAFRVCKTNTSSLCVERLPTQRENLVSPAASQKQRANGGDACAVLGFALDLTHRLPEFGKFIEGEKTPQLVVG